MLRDVDLKVPAGTTVAIVGPTGSGKTTLVSLLRASGTRRRARCSWTATTSGASRSRVLRGAVGFVPQESFLFSDTVRENVALGLSPADAARVEWAAGVAQLAKDLADFPQGFETTVGERGITLSGGQKQRTALARALATDPRILVLDDALSAVDTETEEQILRGAAPGAALAHHVPRLAPRLDREGRRPDRGAEATGRSSSAGTHDELVARGGFYADLHRRQLLEEEIDGEDAA